MEMPFELYVEKTLAEGNRSDHDLVVAVLHPSGDLYGQLTDSQDTELRMLADGCGKGLTRKDLAFYDWSHIRDSHWLKFLVIAKRLRNWGFH
jgi:hypothetical protein